MPLEFNNQEKLVEEHLLIKNTTPEQRIEIIKSGLAFASLDGEKRPNDLKIYQDYIEGRKELRDVINDIIGGIINE